MNTKTVSIRLPIEMIEKIDEKCSEKGCCRNDYVKSVIDEDLNTSELTNVIVYE